MRSAKNAWASRVAIPANRDDVPRPLRVLMVTGAYPTAERPHWAPFIQSQVDSLREIGVSIDVLRPRPGFMPRRYLAAALGTLWRAWRGRYDVIHGHYGLWCLVARLQWTTPVVAAFLGSDLLGARGPDGRKTLAGRITTSVSRWLSRHVDAVTVKSQEMARLTGRADALVLSDGIDLDLFRPLPRADARAALGLDPLARYVLFGADPTRPEKHYALAAAAVARLATRGTAAELIVVNGLPQAQGALYLNACNALLLTSRYEGSPNIVKEAMACCIPVVATDVGDVAEVIGRTAGCVVCPSDADALAAGLERALAHAGPTTGRADIAHLDRRLVALRLVALYERVARQRPVRAAVLPAGGAS